MTSTTQPTPSEPQDAPPVTVDGLVDDAKGSPQGITALAYGYAQGLSSEAGRRVAGVVVVSVDTTNPDAPLQSHMVAAVDQVSMARILRAQAAAMDPEQPAVLPVVPPGDADAEGTLDPWEPTA